MELWKKIGADLRLARGMLSPGAEDDKSIRKYQEFLDHNELELACEMLEEYADEHSASRKFWLALRDASMKMKLNDRAARYEACAAVG